MNMSRGRRCALPITHKMVQQRYHRGEVTPTPGDRVGRSSLPASLFESQSAPPTVCDKQLRGIMEAKSTWLSPSPQGERLMPAALRLLITANESKDWDIVAATWRSMFFVPGAIYERQSDRALFLVLYSCQYGFLAWPCVNENTPDDLAIVAPSTSSKAQCEWCFPKEFDDWQAVPTRVVGPVRAHWVLKDRSNSLFGVRLMCTEPAVGIMRFAATQAFPDVTDFFLNKAIMHFSIAPRSGAPRPKTVLEKVEMLVRHFCIGLTDAQLRDIMLLRGDAEQTDNTLLMTKQAGDAIDRLLEPSDQTEHRKETDGAIGLEARKVNDYLVSRGLLKKDCATGPGSRSLDVAAGGAPAPGGGASRSSSAQRPRERVERPAQVQRARALLPKGVAGVILQPYPDKRTYQIYYPTSEGHQKSRTFTFAAQGKSAFSEAEVLQACVAWCWAQHTRETGQSPPFDWADLPVT